MRERIFVRGAIASATLAAVAALGGCGGGGGDDSSSPGGRPLSTDQQAFERFALASSGGEVGYAWHFDGTNIPSATNGEYLVAETLALPASPSAGPVDFVNSSRSVSDNTVTPPLQSNTRVLLKGAVRFTNTYPPKQRVHYDGAKVLVDTLADDGATTLYTRQRVSVTAVPLTGAIASAPEEFQLFLPPLYRQDGLLRAGAAFASGAQYVRFTEVYTSDKYAAVDCAGNPVTFGAQPSPCFTGTTLHAIFDNGGWVRMPSDEDTYYDLGNGQITVREGMNVYIATGTLPASSSGNLPEHRMFFEMNGNVYQGYVVPAGTTQGLDGSTLFSMRVNQQVADSVRAAVTF